MHLTTPLYILFFLLSSLLFCNNLHANDGRASLDISCDAIESINIFKVSMKLLPSPDIKCTDWCYFVLFAQTEDQAKVLHNWLRDHQGYLVSIYVNNIAVISSHEVPRVPPQLAAIQSPQPHHFQAEAFFCDLEEARQYARGLCPGKLNRLKEDIPGFEVVE